MATNRCTVILLKALNEQIRKRIQIGYTEWSDEMILAGLNVLGNHLGQQQKQQLDKGLAYHYNNGKWNILEE